MWAVAYLCYRTRRASPHACPPADAWLPRTCLYTRKPMGWRAKLKASCRLGLGPSTATPEEGLFARAMASLEHGPPRCGAPGPPGGQAGLYPKAPSPLAARVTIQFRMPLPVGPGISTSDRRTLPTRPCSKISIDLLRPLNIYRIVYYRAHSIILPLLALKNKKRN